MAMTLAEAAAEVLNKSRNNEKEPMHKLGDTGSHLDTVVDLGGATYENPEGADTGKKTAAARGEATPPKGPSVEGDQTFGPDSEKKAGVKAAHAVSNQKAGEDSSPEDNNGWS